MQAKAFFLLFCGLLLSKAMQAQQWGYATLIAPQNSTTVSLLDTNSQVIKTWTGLSGQTAYSCYLMPGGFLWRTVKTTNASFSGGGLAGRVQKVDWNGNVLFDYTVSDASQISHHDICPMPNGDVLLIVYEKKTAAQMTALGASANSARQLEKVVQLHPTGTTTATIAWQWNLADHLVQNTNSAGANYQNSIVNNPQLLNVNYNVRTDWIHMNGIDYNESLDQIVVSSHNLNEMWVIDHSTTTAEAATHSGGASGRGGDFLYRWGNPAAYGATGTAIFNVMHDAHWISSAHPTMAGWLSGMNNKGVSASRSAIDAFQSTWNGSSYTHTVGQAYLPATYGFRHQCTNNTGGSGYTSNMGNSNHLPNGNTLVCLATAANVYEVSPNGTRLWNYQGTGSISQAHRYTRCFIENPSVAVSANNFNVCAGSAVQLGAAITATNATGYTYNWAPAAGMSSQTAQYPTVSPTATTAYTVTITTAGGCTATNSLTVTVNNAPVANAGNDVAIAVGQSTTLTAMGGGNYLWSNGSTTAAITVSPTATTTYTVTVTNASGCTASDQVVVTVSGGALAAVAATSTPNICPGNLAQLGVSAAGGSSNYTYSWTSNPVGLISNQQYPTHSPMVNTTYTVVVSDGNNTVTSSVSVNVFSTPTADAGANVTITSGQSTSLTASGGGTYLWSNGMTTSSINVTPTATTSYSVTVTNANGCTATDQVQVSVVMVLAVTISSTDTVICEGDAIQMFANVTGNSGTVNYYWASNPAGFTSTLPNPYVNPVATTIYTCSVSDGANVASTSFTITVNALPAQPTITANGSVLTSSAAVGNVWYFYGNPIPGGTDQNLTPTLDGSYQVQVIDANGCPSLLSEPYEYLASSIDNIGLLSGWALSPNPSNGEVVISGAVLGAEFAVSVFDELGRQMLVSINNRQLSLDNLPSGLYYVRVETKAGIGYKKLVIAK